MKKQIWKNIEGIIYLGLMLIILDTIFKVTGTVFFGVEFFSVISMTIIVILLIACFESDMKTIQWIKRKLGKL